MPKGPHPFGIRNFSSVSTGTFDYLVGVEFTENLRVRRAHKVSLTEIRRVSRQDKQGRWSLPRGIFFAYDGEDVTALLRADTTDELAEAIWPYPEE